MHDHNPTDDGTDDAAWNRPPTPTDHSGDDDRADRTEHPTDDGTDHDATVVLMKADDGTPQAHYSNGVAGSWIKADRSDLVALEDSR